MPANTSTPAQASSLQRRMRWWIIFGVIIAGIVLYGLARPKEPGADWFAPIDGPKSKEWERASQPAKTWVPRTNDTMGVTYELEQPEPEERKIKITTTNLGNDAQGRVQESQRSDYANLIHANADNIATLPDGAVVRLSELIAYSTGKTPSFFFKFANGTATPMAASTAQPLDRDDDEIPRLQFILDQKPANTVLAREFAIYEASTGRQICSGDGKDGKDLVSYGVPYMPQSSLDLLLQCYYGGTQQLTIPATPGSFAESAGVAVRYCGDIMRKAEETISFHVVFSNNQPPLFGGFGSILEIRPKPDRVFIFTQALGALEVLSAEALLENGEKISLSPVDWGYSESFRAFRGPEKTVTPIHSFVLTLPRRSARIVFTIPQIQELWPRQDTKNRFDLRFSTAEAAQFKREASFFMWPGDLLERITGLRFPSDAPLFRAFESGRRPSLEGVDLTGKTIREAFVIYLQRSRESPADFTTTLDREGQNIFERKKSWGVYAWRWLYRHPALFQWLLDHDTLYESLNKAGIKEG